MNSKTNSRKPKTRAGSMQRMVRRLTHAELLNLIGEIDGITLRSVSAHTVAVLLRIDGREIELIRDSGVNISHSITRIGIAECIAEPPNASGQTRPAEPQ